VRHLVSPGGREREREAGVHLASRIPGDGDEQRLPLQVGHDAIEKRDLGSFKLYNKVNSIIILIYV
jgi:hypothetical protein